MKRVNEYALSRFPQYVRQHIAELQKDKDRLDWLESHPFTAYRNRDHETQELVDHFTLVNEDVKPRKGIVHPTLRSALTAAMRAQGEEGK